MTPIALSRASTAGGRRWAKRRDRWFVGGLVGTLVVATAAILATSSPSHGALVVGPPTTPATTPPDQALAAAVKTVPANGAKGVAPDAEVSVSAGQGKFISVVVETSQGLLLPGSFNQAGTVWTSAGTMAFTTTYYIRSRVILSPGVTANTTSDFTTLTPAATVTANVTPGENTEIGSGQPLVVTLDRPATDDAARQALLSHLNLAMTEPVAVGAHWFSPTELHLRPQTFWPAGERISLSYDLDGWDAGGGDWGTGSGARHVGTNAQRVATLDLDRRELTLTVDGKVASVDPVSVVPPSPPGNGIHLVLNRLATDGGLDWTVALSSAGQTICGLPPGSASGACTALPLGSAERFFYAIRPGDVVEVTGAPGAAGASDPATEDWSLPWSAFTPLPVTATATGTTPTTATPAA